MEDATNPFVIVFFYIIRCGLPLLIMLGISYLLRKFGLLPESPAPKKKQGGKDNDLGDDNGNYAHGKA